MKLRSIAGAAVAAAGMLAYRGSAADAPAPAPVPNVLETGHLMWAAGEYDAARREYARVLADTNAGPGLRSIVQLRIAQSFVRERGAGDPAGIAAVLRRIGERGDLLPHHREELGRMIARLEHPDSAAATGDGLLPAPVLPKPGVELHVATNGSDAAAGGASAPFATLARARDEVRALRDRGPWPTGGVAVVIHGGTYAVREPLKLDGRDSGAPGAPVVYRAAPGEKPVFSGGVRLAGFAKVRDEAVLARFPEEARGKVLVADLRAAGVTNVPPLVLSAYAGGRGFHTHPVTELFFDGAPLTLARWPNEGDVRVAGITTNKPHEIHGQRGSKDGVLIYEGERPARWKDEPEAWLLGYWFWGWAESYEKIAKIDPAAHRIELQPPLHTYGYRAGRPFHALNLLCELDAPGEWYLDRAAGRVYMFPPSDPARAVVELSMAPCTFVELKDASDVAWEGIAWDLGAADAIHVEGGRDVLFAGCSVTRFAGDGIRMRGGTGHTILSCEVRSMGRGGVAISGGDRVSLRPGRQVVANCDIHDLSRIDHTYTPAIHVNGVGQRVVHNRLHHVNSSAMRVEGNDHLVEFNEIAYVVQESDDQGGIDMFGNPTYRGNVYRWNFFHHIGEWRAPAAGPDCGQAGIRLDDAISGTLVYGNVFWRSSAGKSWCGGIQIHGGKDNIVDGNVFVDGPAAVSFSPWNEARWRDHVKDAMTSGQIEAGLYLKRYPELADLAANPNVNHIWRNLVVDCTTFLFHNRGGARPLDNWITPTDPGFDDAAKGRFGLRSDAMAFDRLGIAPIPFDRIGLRQDAWRKNLPAPLAAEKEDGGPAGAETKEKTR